MKNEITLQTRREFLRATVLGSALSWTVPAFLADTFSALHAEAAGSAIQTVTGKDSTILVVLQMAGGNDGINTVVPYANDYYHQARPKLGLKAADVLKLNDEIGLHGALTGFHWGTGSAMTSVEMMSPLLGDGYIDLREERGVGFDECTIRKVQVTGDRITFELESKMKQRSFVLRFAHVDPERTYRVSWNSGAVRRVEGRELIAHGLQVSPLIAAN